MYYLPVKLSFRSTELFLGLTDASVRSHNSLLTPWKHPLSLPLGQFIIWYGFSCCSTKNQHWKEINYWTILKMSHCRYTEELSRTFIQTCATKSFPLILLVYFLQKGHDSLENGEILKSAIGAWVTKALGRNFCNLDIEVFQLWDTGCLLSAATDAKNLY